MPPSAPLSDAVDAARRQAWPACLAALLVAWRASRTPALAELIERVSPRAPGAPIAPRGSRVQAVKARIATLTDVDVDPIVEFTLREVRTTPVAYKWLLALAAARADDPRVARGLAQLVKRSPYVDRAGALYADTVKALAAQGDPRFDRLLIDAAAELGPQRGKIRKYRAALDVLVATAAELEARPAPASPPGLAAAITAIDAALAAQAAEHRHDTRDAAALLAAIYADPADLSLRLVYADVLQQAGDPRGEFIALQCTRAADAPPTPRERELLAAHGRAWLGNLDRHVHKQGVVYARGFLAAARLNRTITDATDPLWSTIEMLDLVSSWDHSPEKPTSRFVTDPRWRALRKVYNVYGDDLPTLGTLRDELPWTALGVRYLGRERRAESRQLGCFPALRELDLSEEGDPLLVIEDLAGSRLMQPVRRLRLGCAWRIGATPPDEIVRVAKEHGIAELELVPSYRFPLPGAGVIRLIDDHLELELSAELKTAYITYVIGRLAPGSLRTVTVRADRMRISEDHWASIAGALERHGIAPPPRPGAKTARAR